MLAAQLHIAHSTGSIFSIQSLEQFLSKYLQSGRFSQMLCKLPGTFRKASGEITDLFLPAEADIFSKSRAGQSTMNDFNTSE
jgi:hypothetical protein